MDILIIKMNVWDNFMQMEFLARSKETSSCDFTQTCDQCEAKYNYERYAW